jgi:hypothetical protein
LRDGFVDRYTGQRLIYIGALRLLSYLMPTDFPYHKNGKMDQCHIAYWELIPTIDHIVPISRGGMDHVNNWVTTSMLSNARKANWTLDKLQWSLYPPGNLDDWDGLIGVFLGYVESNKQLLEQNFIKKHYTLAEKHFAISYYQEQKNNTK